MCDPETFKTRAEGNHLGLFVYAFITSMLSLCHRYHMLPLAASDLLLLVAPDVFSGYTIDGATSAAGDDAVIA